MTPRLALFFVLLLSAQATAAESFGVFAYDPQKTGTFMIAVTVKPDGTVESRPLPLVFRLDGQPNPNPAPGPTPTPTDRFGLTALARSLQSSVADPSKADTAALIAAAYSGVADQIDAGKITDPQTAASVMPQLLDRLLSPAQESAWATWRAAIKARLDALSAGGQIRTTADVATAFREIAAGTSSGAALNPATIQMIIQLILLILGFFKKS